MSMRKLYRPSWAAWVSLLAHIVWLAVFAYILWVGPSGRTIRVGSHEVWAPYCKTCDGASDAIRTAAEIGRLDMVSMSLAVLGVSLAIAALGSYAVIRNAAMGAAREEANERTQQMLPELLTPALIAQAMRQDPKLQYAVAALVRRTEADIAPDDANAIAGAVEEGV